MRVRWGVTWTALALLAGCTETAAREGDGRTVVGGTSAGALRRALRSAPIGIAPAIDDRVVPTARGLPTPIAPMPDRAETYVLRRSDLAAFFTARGFALAVSGACDAKTCGWGLHATLSGARDVAPLPEREQQGKVHEYVGAPAKWRTGLPVYGQLVWEEPWPGVDMVVEPSRGGFAYRFVASPGADVARIAMEWSGATSIRTADEGRALEVVTDLGVLRASGLRAFAIEGDQRRELPARHVVSGTTVTIVVDGWSGAVPLVIDPAIAWSSYLGGTTQESGEGIAADAFGNALVTGHTISSNFPTTTGALDTSFGGLRDAFVTKVSAAGALVWSTFLGGSGSDMGNAVLAVPSGNVFVTGGTTSTDFPSTGGFDTTLGGFDDAFVTKLTPAGALMFSTYLGGTSSDTANAIAFDGVGANVYVVGETTSTDFPTAGGFDTTYNGTRDVFIAKIAGTGPLLWSSYLGGSDFDQGFGVAADASGNAFLTGQTSSTNFPTTGGFDATVSSTDAFVTKVTAAGALAWSSYLGGTGADSGKGIAVDASGNAFVVGTAGIGFPMMGAFDPSMAGNEGFVTKVSGAGAMLWSSYLGGADSDSALAVAIDPSGNALVTGETASTIGFPGSSAGFDTTYNGGFADGYVARITSGGTLQWSSYFGGSAVERGHAIAIDSVGNTFITGVTSSSDFPKTGAFDTTYADNEAFVLALNKPQALASACTSGVDCVSGACADGVCCDKPCGGVCEACTATKKGAGADGTCGAIADGRDPDMECPAATCSGATIVKAQRCNGAGACRSDGTTSCGAYQCKVATCPTTCSIDGDCATGNFCDASACVATLARGSVCTRATQCASGLCADGFCCDKACAGACEACSAAKKGSGTDGTCAPVAADTDPKNACPTDPGYPSNCKADGMCDGMGACRGFAKLGIACGATTCSSATIVGQICNATGSCQTSSTSCAPYAACADGTSCPNKCTSESDCVATAFCNTASICALKKKNGESCGSTKECTSGYCADGYCCNAPCTGQCEACGEATSEGTCIPVSGAPRGKRTPCAGDPAMCGGSCDGSKTSECKYAPSTKGCGSACKSGQEVVSTCDGLGACVDGTGRACGGGFGCDADGKACATSCAADSHCASGFKCSGSTCVPISGSGKCSDDLQTSTSTDGKITNCGAYRCDPSTGACRQICASTDDCAAGNLCNVAAKICEPAAAADEETGGCGCTLPGGEHAPRGTALLVALGAISIYARRRRTR